MLLVEFVKLFILLSGELVISVDICTVAVRVVLCSVVVIVQVT